MYRNDWDAAVARAAALEEQLRQAQAGKAQDAEAIARLHQQLAATQAELARLRGGAYGYPPPFAVLPPARGGAILTLGILSLVLCGLLGPIAWAMSSNDLAAIDRGELDPRGRGTVTAGRVCGIIGTVLMIVQIVAMFMMFGMITSF